MSLQDPYGNPLDPVWSIASHPFEMPWPWLHDYFGIWLFRHRHPSCSFWIGWIKVLPFVLSCSPRNRHIWIDLKEDRAGNFLRRAISRIKSSLGIGTADPDQTSA